MRDYFLEADATEDLDSIYEYIARENRTAAAKMLHDIYATFEVIAANPDAGRRRNELASGLQSLVFRNYVILYRVTKDEIRINRILHGARDLSKIVFE